VKENPFVDDVAAVSCGLYKGTPVLDLDYAEDSNAEADANFVITGKGGLVEIQGTAEHRAFSEEQFMDLMKLARKGVTELIGHQKKALGA
jgi:ribonuclease PH